MSQSATRQGGSLSHRPLGIFLPAALLVAATLLVYLPALRAGFIWDDDVFLTANRLIKAQDGLFHFWFTTEPPDYFPLTSTSLWLEWRAWGTNPAGYHLVNVLLHAASAVLLWRVLTRLKLPGAWLASLIFAVHPVNVESVAWITERKNTLPMVFYLASLLAYLKFEDGVGDWEIGRLGNSETGKLGDSRAGQSPNLAISQSPNPHVSASLPLCGIYFVSILLFLLALLAKTSVATLPLVLLLCAWWRRGRVGRNDLLRAVPFFALSLALSLVTVWFQYHRAIAATVVRTDGLLARMACAGWAAWFYLYKAVLPSGLCFVYPRWTVGVSLLSFVPVLLLLATLWLFWRHRSGWGRPCLFALGYFLLALLPVLGFLNIYFMRFSFVADHWQYMALIAVVAPAAALLASAIEAGGATRKLGTAACVLIIGGLAASTWSRSGAYENAESVWRNTLLKNPGAWMAHNNLGLILSNKEEALFHFNAALRLKNDYAEAYNNRGLVYAETGRSDEAMSDFNKAISLDKDLVAAYDNRANALASKGRYDLALPDYDRVIRSRPDNAVAYYDRGCLYAAVNDPAAAIQDYDRAISLDKDIAAAYNNRGTALAGLRRLDDAVRDYSRAIDLNPQFSEAYSNRAVTYYRMKEYAKALADVRMCRKLGRALNPGFVRSVTKAAGEGNTEE